MTQKKEYTWDDTANAVGQDFSGGVERVAADTVERTTIRRFLEPVELDCPLHYDDDVAKAHGFEGIIAPWSSINATFTRAPIWEPGQGSRWDSNDPDGLFKVDAEEDVTPEIPKPVTTTGFATDIEIEYIQPVYVGDKLTVKGRKLVSVAVKTTSVGHGAFMVWESEIYNQKNELVAVQRNGGYQYNPHPAP